MTNTFSEKLASFLSEKTKLMKSFKECAFQQKTLRNAVNAEEKFRKNTVTNCGPALYYNRFFKTPCLNWC
jgi:hypothetical protein